MDLKHFIAAMLIFFIGVSFMEWSLLFSDWAVLTTRSGRLVLFIFTILALNASIKRFKANQMNDQVADLQKLISSYLQNTKNSETTDEK